MDTAQEVVRALEGVPPSRIAEALGLICEKLAKENWGGAPGSITANRRKALQGAATRCATMASVLRGEAV